MRRGSEMGGEEPRKRSFWVTIPGILTGTATVITAIVSLIIALHQLGGGPSSPNIPILSVASPSESATPSPSASGGSGGEKSPSNNGTTSSASPSTSLSDIQPMDCIPYDSTRLSVVNEGASGWLLTDGVARMEVLDNATDAQRALALARRHTAQCFIGRDNTRADRRAYIVEYWGGDSGLNTTIDPEDCIGYERDRLSILDEGASGWLLTDGRSRMLVLDNQQDAQNALILAKVYTNQCFIGRNNTRTDRLSYIVQYWR
jgi:hypothetical protein